jgi:DNA-binding response OmpR family regulator
MLVLVAHTNQRMRLLVRGVLTEAGSTVIEASNGMSALRLGHPTQPDLVLLGPTPWKLETCVHWGRISNVGDSGADVA